MNKFIFNSMMNNWTLEYKYILVCFIIGDWKAWIKIVVWLYVCFGVLAFTWNIWKTKVGIKAFLIGYILFQTNPPENTNILQRILRMYGDLEVQLMQLYRDGVLSSWWHAIKILLHCCLCVDTLFAVQSRFKPNLKI